MTRRLTAYLTSTHRTNIDRITYGPFRDDADAEHWASLVRPLIADGWSPVEARSLVIGEAEGDAPMIVTRTNRMGKPWVVHPATFDGIDYGKPVLTHPDLPRHSLKHDAVAFVRNLRANNYYDVDPAIRKKFFGGDISAFPSINIDNRRGVVHRRASEMSGGGEIVLLSRWEYLGYDDSPYDPPKYIVAWRRDGRSTREPMILSGHTDMECAMSAVHEEALTFNYPIGPRKNRVADYQRSKIYAWENKLYPGTDLMTRWESAASAYQWARGIWADLDLTMDCPTIRLSGRLRVTSYYVEHEHAIHLAPAGMNRGTVLHELGHAIHRDLAGTRVPVCHDADFVGILMVMYAKFAGIELARMVETAEAAGISFSTAEQSRLPQVGEFIGRLLEDEPELRRVLR
jgi:hypothetical protein